MRDYRIYVHDIIDAMEKIETFTRGMSFEEFSSDEKTIGAVRDKLIIIGEAAKNIPQEFGRLSRSAKILSYVSIDGH